MLDEPDLLHLNVESTNPWPIRENLRTFPTFMPSFLARVRISCFRKTAFTSSPFPCNLLMLSELWVKDSFSLFAPNYLICSVLGVKTSRLLFLHPLFTSFSGFLIFPPCPRHRPAL